MRIAALLVALAAALAGCTTDRFPEAFDAASIEIVYLADSAHADAAPERLAAEDLARWIATMTGAAAPPVRPSSPELGLEALAGDRARVVLVIGRGALADAVVANPGPLAAEEWRIERMDLGEGERTVVALTGGSALASQYAAYVLAHEMGIRFVHPEREFVPRRAQVPIAWPLSLRGQPALALRSFSLRTERPIELDGPFLEAPDEASLAEHRIDWLVKTQQNQLEWRLLDSLAPDATLRRARELVEHAHRRGLRAGVVVSLLPGGAHELALVHPEQPDPEGQLTQTLDLLLAGAPWDSVHITLDAYDLGALPAGPGAPAPDLQARTWLAAAAEHLRGRAALTVSGHSVVAAGSALDLALRELLSFPAGAAPAPGPASALADAAITLAVRGSTFAGLFGRAARYGAPAPTLAQDIIERGLGQRQVAYLAETANGPADLEVPLFLPSTVVARARDAAWLADQHDRSPRLAGRIALTSGGEWGAWLSDYAAATLAVHPRATSREIFGDVAAGFGPGGPQVADTLEALARRLDAAITSGLLGYLAGDDDLGGGRIGALAALGGSSAEGTLTAPGSFSGRSDAPASAGSLAPLLNGPLGAAAATPAGDDRADARIPFARIGRMREEALAGLERGDLARLQVLADDLDGFAKQLDDARTSAVPEAAASWLAELAAGASIDALRARHTLSLYHEVIEAHRARMTTDAVAAGAHRTAALGAARLAGAIKMQALAIVAAEESRYRYPPDRTIAGFDPALPASNATIYPFGLLARVHLLSDWSRREMLADAATQGAIDDRLLRVTVSQVGAAESVTADAAALYNAGWRGALVAFGDDGPAEPLLAGSPYLFHRYARTGAYDVTLTATDVTGRGALLTVPVAVVATALVVRPDALTVTQPAAGRLRDSLAHAITPLVFGVEDVSGSLCKLALAGDDDDSGTPDPGRLANLPPGVRTQDHCAIAAARWALPVTASSAGDALPGRALRVDADLGFLSAGAAPSGLTNGRLSLSLHRADLAALLIHDEGLEPDAADAAVTESFPTGDWLRIELGFTAVATPTR